jgi:hypothetical protein
MAWPGASKAWNKGSGKHRLRTTKRKADMLYAGQTTEYWRGVVAKAIEMGTMSYPDGKEPQMIGETEAQTVKLARNAGMTHGEYLKLRKEKRAFQIARRRERMGRV